MQQVGQSHADESSSSCSSQQHCCLLKQGICITGQPANRKGVGRVGWADWQIRREEHGEGAVLSESPVRNRSAVRPRTQECVYSIRTEYTSTRPLIMSHGASL
ncbi:hypothetical protein AAFF_G00064920 [Aldrovandia affinis]|uniref:Uncharacterized protein n=1 Tax=Aldrovandia affinis TaxID=143900 RepID=A0AAD7WZI6_9TELE|nr:hypothetical protein AAFF_G00064920 [Aldrovandia affinis]